MVGWSATDGEAGVIAGFRAVIDYEAIGFPILSIIRLKAPGRAAGIDDAISAIPNVIEANRITGSDSHVLRARLRHASDLEVLLSDVWEQGDTITNIVTSSPVPRRPMNLTATDAGRDT